MEAKKTPKADLTKKTSLFLAIGLVLSLGVTLMAFEWKKYDEGELMDLGMAPDDFEELTEIPPTEQPPPPPPKIQQPQIIEIPDEEEIEEEIEIDLDVEITEETEVEEIVFEEEPEEEEAEEIFMVVEEQASFPGGMGEWNKFLKKNLKYPRQATRMGIEGAVFLSFVVDKQGVISDINVIRGIGGGCDEEAIRVLKESPRWAPGKQRGRAVKSRMQLRIVFRLK
ncbi:outer membrane transport energization protein TonB [Roseivirga pacifica]|uniref:Outer membrane transport energization protein TonB n=1 Tax=Roseivirga pacifica TaxID=1267423 RepID=A0A1I0RKL1_9BACT|nr:energy transducer TonB [Roseivirga pacifica]MCO6357887.1 TonB family protein [Roseivirga pacifica]MCO6366139.1 TonB family protein [Roseivirga pacifica]MCO6371467.1 TonB family protein [Roseivirga pacifica]MCO6375361.1 TonB family protein [Roseivirga pacifica]MCO6378845.1 TonB family protein [Roseivirga pacifica]